MLKENEQSKINEKKKKTNQRVMNKNNIKRKNLKYKLKIQLK